MRKSIESKLNHPPTMIYSENFRIKVVNEVENGIITKAEANRKYGIKGHSTVLKWCRKYGSFNHNMRKIISYTDNKSTEKDENSRLKAELKAEKKRIKDLEAYNKLLEAFIQIGKEDYNIDLKKNGSKLLK